MLYYTTKDVAVKIMFAVYIRNEIFQDPKDGEKPST